MKMKLHAEDFYSMDMVLLKYFFYFSARCPMVPDDMPIMQFVIPKTKSNQEKSH